MEEEIEDEIDEEKIIIGYNITFVGDAGTGKTSLMNRIISNPFNKIYDPSIGVDFMSKKYRYQGQNIKILIWDTAGQEKYKGLIPSYIRTTSIVFIVYDISNRASFENVQKWISFVRSIEKGMIVLCGIKS